MAAQIVQVIIEIGHKAWYRKKATLERTHDWILFVRGSEGNDLSHFVEKIVFNLHQSFNPPRRVFKSPPYELRESGYGEFMPVIDIYFKNKGEKGAPRKVTLQYYLNLNREDSPPIDNVRPEKLKFHNPADEFLEKVLKAGGVILGPDGCPLAPKPRPPAPDLQPSASQTFDSRGHDASDFLVDVDSAAKSATQLAKKRKRSTEANPMSNDSNSSNESLLSRRSSSKSDPFDKDSDACGTKRKMHAALFDPIDDESSKKKKKQAPQPSDKADSHKPRSVEQKPVKVDAAEDNKHRSSKDEGHKHSSGKSHHRRDDGRHDHREKSVHGHAHGKPKSGDRNSRSSSRTPSKVKNLESSSGSRVHGSSSSHGGGLSTHHRSSSSGSRHHSSSSKSSKVEVSRHGGSQSQKRESSSSMHRGSSSNHRSSSSDTKGDNSLSSRKMDIQVRLSPVDIQSSESANPRSSSSVRKLETSSGNRIGPSPDGFSSQKPSHLSPVKKRPKNTILASPVGYLPPTFDLNGKSYDDPFSSANRIRPKYDKLLDDMKSDDEEEDGEIRSPVATEPPELLPWKATSSGDRKDEKSKESSLDRKKSSSRTSSSATPRLEKAEKFPFGTEKPSPTKTKSDWSSSLSSEKTSPEDVSFSVSQVKAKKSHTKENIDGDPRSSKKPNISKSSGQKDFIGSQRTSEKTAKQTTKGLPASDISFTAKSEADEKDGHEFFKVEPLWDNSYATSKTNDVALKKEIESYAMKNEPTFYDEKKSNDVMTKSEPMKGTTYSDRAPNGELLMSLVEMKEKINRVTSAALLNRIIDVIQAAGQLKSDDEALEFDFCQLEPETMQRVKQLLEAVSD